MSSRSEEQEQAEREKQECEEGLPRCQSCHRVLLDGSTEAWKEKDDIGDWMSLELLCPECVPKGSKNHRPLKCECNQCACRNNAVTVLAGFQSCASCEKDHAKVVDPDQPGSRW